MGKQKYSPSFKIARCKDYIEGKGSYRSIAKEYGLDRENFRHWVTAYNVHGEAAFIKTAGNNSYSKEFKIHCIEEVLTGHLSIKKCVTEYNICDKNLLKSWIKKYNANRELKDYDPKREVYMAEARRKTTIEERKEIVKYCIEHGRDYKGTASLYDVSYTQVYNWVRKYDSDGEDALIDKRGHHKTDDEVDELERLRRENIRLKRKLEEKDMLVTLLKKVKELEGM